MKKDLLSVLRRPRVTEKASRVAERSVYVFEVDPQATKNLVHKAFIEKYKITPVRINTVTIPAKQLFVRGKMGTKSGYKKAYIYLAKGQKLES